MLSSTPVRTLGIRTETGYILLRDVDSQYRDGSEDRILEILRSCDDVSANSDEPYRHADGWAERYHTTPARANVIRNLPLPTDAKVLEIGAGCGAVTRYLGENCALVDALEPVPSRAAAATERCRDLPQVQVLVGELEDVPAEPTYDIIVVVGVLEYVGAGSADLAPYRGFLNGIAARLNPSGSLVLAIENKLGVKYLVGAPEDHSGRVFDSIEGYPYGSPARTFSRHELESLLKEAGLTPRTALAFPDYKLTRTVLRPQHLPESVMSLLYRIPNFPSPDWLVTREHLGKEGLVWKSLVEAGLALESGNSFVVVAGKNGVSPLWDEADAGAFYSLDRRRSFMVTTDLRVDQGSVTLVRRFNEPDLAADIDSAGWTLETATAQFTAGLDFLDAFNDVNDPVSLELLKKWVALVDADADAVNRSVDLVPHNLIVDDDGSVSAIDEEWHTRTMGPADVLRRGALLFALRLAARGRVTAEWNGCTTFVDIAQAVADQVGVGSDPQWLSSAVTLEAEFLAAVTVSARDGLVNRVNDLKKYLRGTLDRGIHTPADFEARLRGLRQSEEGLAGRLAAVQEELVGAADHVQMLKLHRYVESGKLDEANHTLGQVQGEVKRLEAELRLQYQEKLKANQEFQRIRAEMMSAREQVSAIQATKSYRATKLLRVIRAKIPL